MEEKNIEQLLADADKLLAETNSLSGGFSVPVSSNKPITDDLSADTKPILIENDDISEEIITIENEALKEELIVIDNEDLPEEDRMPGFFEPTSGRIEVAGDVIEDNLYVSEDDTVYIPEEVFNGEYLTISDTENDEISEEIQQTIRRVKKLSPEEILARKKKKTQHNVVMGLWHTFSIARVFLVLALSVFLAMKIINYGSEFLGINRPDKLQLVRIESGMTADDIADKLIDQDLITKKNMFKVIVRLRKDGDKFVKGEHYVSANMGYTEMIAELTTSVQRETVRITFREGIYLKDAVDLLTENGVIGKITADTTAEEKAEFTLRFLNIFNNYTNDYNFEKYLVPLSQNAFYAKEGFFFPDTYEFYKYKDEEDLNVVCAKILDNFESHFTEEMYTQMQLKGYTMNDLIALASIVQAEAPDIEEMEKVSSVFQNRLKNPAGIGRTQPYLESDPTKKYIEQIIRKNMDPSNQRNHIMAEYDTYEKPGLPATAICNPGIDAINAVLYPANTNYYYFAANVNTKETLYSENLPGHEKNLEIIEQQYEDAVAAE
jgi:UPF0755 protein